MIFTVYIANLCIQQYVQGYRSSADIFTHILEKYVGSHV